MIGHDQRVSSGLPTFLVGAFEGEERVHATQWVPARDVMATARGESAVAGATIVVHHEQRAGDEIPFAALNVFGLGSTPELVVLWSFDSYGASPDPPARGSWRDGELVLDRRTPRGVSRTVYRQTSDGFAWSKSFAPSVAEPHQLVVEGRLRRVEEP